MHICDCEHPKYVYNPFTGENIRVNCGKCASCMNAKAKTWISRLLEESQVHKYAFMINLTYDDDHLPVLGFSDDMKSLVYVNRDSECIPISELTDLVTEEKDMYYLSARLRDPLGLPVQYPKDYSDFFKRFNKYVHDNITGTYENIRYFLCPEYGPATFRCHAHAIVWVDSPRVADRFKQILSSCWSLGDCTASCIYSSGGVNYVAQYVNMLTHLPAFYSHPRLRCNLQFSKFPSIGSLSLLATEIRDIYDRKFVRRTVWDSLSSEYVDIPVGSTFKNRYFPKCPKYSTWSYSDRVALYRAVEIIPSTDLYTFRTAFHDLEWLFSRGLLTKSEKVLWLWSQELRANSKDLQSYYNGLKRLFYISKRVKWIAYCLHTSIDTVVRQIDEFYKLCDYDLLKEFYSWQEEYSKSYPVQDLVYCYPEFVYDLAFFERFPRSPLPDRVSFAIDTFNLDMIGERSLEKTKDFQRMVSRSFKIYKDTHKRHDVSNYRHSVRLRSLNPSLQKILLKYESYAS